MSPRLHAVGLRHDADDDRVGDGHRQADVDVGVRLDRVARPARVHARVLAQRLRDDRGQQIGVGQLDAAASARSPGPNFSRAATSAVPSTSRDTKKCGAVVQLCVVRSAMILPIELSAPTSVETRPAPVRPRHAEPMRRGRRRGRRRSSRREHVLSDDFAPGPGALDPRDVDAVLLREAARLRRNLDGAGDGDRPPIAPAAARRRGGRRGLRGGRAGSSRLRGRLAAGGASPGLQQPRNRLPHRHDVAGLRGDAAENPVAGRFDLDDGLVGFDFEQQLALLDARRLPSSSRTRACPSPEPSQERASRR